MDEELNSAFKNERYFCQVIGCVTWKSSQTWKSGLKSKENDLNDAKLMFRSSFRKKSFQICYKNALSEQVLGKWMHFQSSLSLWELHVIRYLLCVRDVAETSLNNLFKLLLILKSSHCSCSVEKVALKNFTGKHLFWSLFLIKLQVVSECWCLPLKFAKFLRTLIFKNNCISRNFVYNAWKKIQLKRCKQNPLKHIWWSFLEKQLKGSSS